MADRLQNFEVTPAEEGMRLDRFLAARFPDRSRAWVQKLIRSGRVRCCGTGITLLKSPVHAGAVLEAALPEAPEVTGIAAGTDFPYPVLYEDDAMLVINKPPGVVVHPGAGVRDGTVLNALLFRCPGLLAEAGQLTGEASRPGIVHRLDKDTSGCLVLAKSLAVQSRLCAAFADRKTAKTYRAWVLGVPRTDSGRIEGNIGRHPVNRLKMAVLPRGGKEAVTLWRVLRSGLWHQRKVSLLEVQILTGRTHQIRVHMSSVLKLPVLGDPLYGGGGAGMPDRQMLHACRLTLPHPVTGQECTFTAPVPEDFRAIDLELEDLP